MPQLPSNEIPYNPTAEGSRKMLAAKAAKASARPKQNIVVLNTVCTTGEEGKHQRHLDAMMVVETEKHGYTALQVTTVVTATAAGNLFTTTVLFTS